MRHTYNVPIRLLTSPADDDTYDAWVRAHPHGSLWQSLEWKKYQESMGRETRIYVVERGTSYEARGTSSDILAAALVIIDRTVGGFSTWEIPRGPILASEDTVDPLLIRILEDAKTDKCIECFYSPCIEPRVSNLVSRTSPRHVQPQATRIVDLTQADEAILAQMHPKGRYNISVARKHGVEGRTGSIADIDAFYALLKDTGARDGFTVSQKSHYTRFLGSLDQSFVLIATHDKKPIAGLMGVVWNGTGIYYYGASSYEHRNLMAPYLLQWEAMKTCKDLGCSKYDLLGIEPPQQEPATGNRQPGTWYGISDFKRKFGGQVILYPAEQTIILRPVIKRLLGLKRRLMG